MCAKDLIELVLHKITSPSVALVALCLTGPAAEADALHVYDYGSTLSLNDGNWSVVKSGSYWDTLYTTSLAAHEWQLWNQYGGEVYANRGAYRWQAPAGQVITSITYYGAVAGYLNTFNAAVFTSTNPSADISSYDVAWSKYSTTPGPWQGESNTLYFSAGSGITSIGVGFYDTLSDNTHKVRFSGIVITTTDWDRGLQLVRSRPFSINAFVDVPTNMGVYAGMNFTNTIANVPYSSPNWANITETIFGGSVAQGLPWTWYYSWIPGHDEDAVSGVNNLRARFSDTENQGFLIGDEVEMDALPAMGRIHSRIRQAAPNALVYSVMRSMDYPIEPSDYANDVHSMAKNVRPDILMFDAYPFYNYAIAPNYLHNLEIVRAEALAAGLPYGTWLQAFDFSDAFAPEFHAPSDSELRFQAFAALTYGYTTLSYWTYAANYYPYSTAIRDGNGALTATGSLVTSIIPELRVLGEELKYLVSTNVYYYALPGNWAPTGTVAWSNQDARIAGITVTQTSGDAGVLMGFFDKSDGKKYLMLTNGSNDQSLNAHQTAAQVKVQFASAITSLKKLDRTTGTWSLVNLNNHELSVTLPGGTGDLFEFVGAYDYTTTYNYANSLNLTGGNWTLVKNGSYWNTLYASSLADHECELWNKYGGDSYPNRGAYRWQAPTGRVITRVSYCGAVSGYRHEFNAAVFTCTDQTEDISNYNIAWSMYCTNYPNWTDFQVENKVLYFSAGSGIKSLGFGFYDTYSDNYHTVSFSDIVIETAPAP